jgi:hypothetical protein
MYRKISAGGSLAEASGQSPTPSRTLVTSFFLLLFWTGVQGGWHVKRRRTPITCAYLAEHDELGQQLPC